MVGGTALGDTMERHIFGNASLEATAAVAYIKITRNQETLTRFLMVKRRVWPLLQTTIHRVKLQVALYAAILKKTIEDGMNFKFDEILLWSDSTTVHNKLDNKRRICNAKAPQSGTSLNDKLLAGPDLLGNMLGFLLRFQEVAIAIQGDIKAMFMQTGVGQQDPRYLRFMRRQTNNPELEVYGYQRHIFGIRDTPACANFVLKQTAKDDIEDHPNSLQNIRQAFYLDDMVSTFSDAITAFTKAKDIKVTLKKINQPDKMLQQQP